MDNLRIEDDGRIVYRYLESDKSYYRGFVEACIGSCVPGAITVTEVEECVSSFSGMKSHDFVFTDPKDFMTMDFSDCWIEYVCFGFDKEGLGRGKFTLGGAGGHVVCRLDRNASAEVAVEWLKELDARATEYKPS